MPNISECPWCAKEFPPKPGQRFCVKTHKRLHEKAAREFGKAMVDMLKPGALKGWKDSQQPPALATGASQGVDGVRAAL